MSQWQPISTAPKDGTWVWTFWPILNTEDQQRVARWHVSHYDGAFWQDSADVIDWCQPTHWMPLPPPPQQEEGKS